MTKEWNTQITDEILHFLYSHFAFQALQEHEQQQFITQFQHNAQFIEIVEISSMLQESIFELEAMMPKIQDKDILLPPESYQQLMKDQTVVSDNIYYVPFGQNEQLYSPIVIALQQSDSMKDMEAFCKGTILPIFNLSARQKRDLVIIPFGQTVGKPLYFHHAHLQPSLFADFIEGNKAGEAEILPVLNTALELLQQNPIKNEAELMIITDNHYTDFAAFSKSDIGQKLKQLGVEISVIAMNEKDFDAQPIQFAHKVFFAEY
ncbi:vWA domain-containing protein [Solibacillus cecembensis]|uniref:vWA domain-containing protein n=1 Tax=Solibacillus cecembensis TaxID=459347 RepID=UPI003CFD2CB4